MNATRLLSEDACPALSDPIHTKQIRKGALTLYLDPSYDVPQLHAFIDAIRSGDLSRLLKSRAPIMLESTGLNFPALQPMTLFTLRNFSFEAFGIAFP